jgi:hypothetical protein
MSQILSAEIQELKKRQQFVLYKVTLLCLVNNNVQLQCETAIVQVHSDYGSEHRLKYQIHICMYLKQFHL